MKIVKTASGSKIKLSKKEWKAIGKQAGWIKANIIPDDGMADGGEPYTDEEMDIMEPKEAKWISFSFGTTPEEIIKERVEQQTPGGYPMVIKDQETWSVIAKAVNQGIDSHLEGFTRSTFDNGHVNIHPEEMTTFLRRLYEDGSEEAWSLRTDILSTLNVEEI